jgi:hypothetical protein
MLRPKPIGAGGRAAERKFARRVGGKQTPGSGGPRDKGDVRKGDWLIECKSTTAASIRVQLSDLAKISHEALMSNGRSPALTVQFVDLAGNPVRCGSWVMVPEDVFKRMTDAARE